ncbi:alpha/beta fold hydrolase [Humibacter antri]
MGRPTKVLVPFAVAGAIGVAVAAGYVTAATVVAKMVVTPTRRKRDDVGIRAVASDLSTLTLTGSADALRVPGRYGLWFSSDRGYARIGDIVALADDGSVTRKVESVVWGDLHTARSGRLSSWYYASPSDLGLPVESVDVAVDNGTAPAWLFPAERSADRWAIHVHGRGTQRQETLRGIPVFHEKGFASLVISYRNDGDAPASPDGRYGLGSTEWRDVDAAIAYAVAHGARHVVLVGWSMGGAIVLQASVRSPHADSVRGIVLDSPVVDWLETLDFQAGLMRLPRGVAQGALVLLDSAWATGVVGQDAPVGLAGLDFTVRANELSTPVLLMHSDDDGYVPPDASYRLAESRPDIVTFVGFGRAKHTKLWNYDRDRWTSAVSSWLDELIVSLDLTQDPA